MTCYLHPVSLPLFFALYCVEAGVFFVIAPWTRVWTVNPFLHHTLAIAAWADNPFIRGFVSGCGVVHILIGIKDIIRITRERRAES